MLKIEKTAVAVAWATGLVQIVPRKPPGACVICRGEPEAVRSLMNATVRHGQGKADGMMLVPGVPEAETQAKGMDALIEFVDWLKSGHLNTEGITSWGR